MLRAPPLKRHPARASNTLSFGFQIYYQAALHKTLVSSLSGRFGATPRVGWGDQLGGPVSGPLQDNPMRNTVSTGQDLREAAEVSSPGVLCAPGAARERPVGLAAFLLCWTLTGHRLCSQSLSCLGSDKNPGPEGVGSSWCALQVAPVASLVAGPAAVATSGRLSHRYAFPFFLH